MSLSGFSVKRSLHSPAGPSGFVDMGAGESVSHSNPGVLVAAKVSFFTNGTVHDFGPTAANDNGVMSAGEWWSEEPATGIGSSYDVREEGTHFGDSWFYQASSLDVWVQMSANRAWGLRRLGMSLGTNSGWGIFEIRTTGSGTYIDRQAYTVSIDNTI